MKTLKSDKTQKWYETQMRKMLILGRSIEYEKLKSEYIKLLEINEPFPLSAITREMDSKDREKANKLLQKMCISVDIADGCLVDLNALLKRYDPYLNLPLMLEIEMMKKLTKNVRNIVDGASVDPRYAIHFGEMCDIINEKIDEAYEKGY